MPADHPSRLCWWCLAILRSLCTPFRTWTSDGRQKRNQPKKKIIDSKNIYYYFSHLFIYMLSLVLFNSFPPTFDQVGLNVLSTWRRVDHSPILNARKARCVAFQNQILENGEGIKRLPEMNLFCHSSYPSPGQACLYIGHDDSFLFCVFHLTCVPLISAKRVTKRV